MGSRLGDTLRSLRREWHEAPWFVLLVIVVAALVGPGLVMALWDSATGVF